jgi:lipopolysaccharide/colanic/teichoic acid biosynthesis glycosyltransferase
VGLNGRYFKIIKFRTMNDNVIDDEELKKLNKKSKIVFKATEDPRITKLGSFLRKSSLDELPQIINVLKNEMSFIGPRPPIISEVKQYELKHLKRISVKPGITGLWQVTLRQDNNFDRWVEKDIEYIENWSVVLDFKILLKTFNEIIGMTGE